MLKTTKFWLIASLCLNLVLIGILAGGVFKSRQMRGEGAPPANEVTAIMRSLPPENRRDLIENFRNGDHPKPQPDINVLADLIEAEPFEPARIEALFDETRGANDARIRQAQSALLASIAQASVEERRQIAENLRKMPKREGARKGDHSAGPPKPRN